VTSGESLPTEPCSLAELAERVGLVDDRAPRRTTQRAVPGYDPHGVPAWPSADSYSRPLLMRERADGQRRPAAASRKRSGGAVTYKVTHYPRMLRASAK